MKEDTQQKIVKALERMLLDLTEWLDRLGASEAQIMPGFLAAVHENGIMAKDIYSNVANFVPLTREVPVRLENVEQLLAEFRSGEFAKRLLDQPEPEPAVLDRFLHEVKSALASYAHQLQESGRRGPRHRRGGRPIGIADATERQRIREQIKSLREPGIKLEDIFERLAQKYGVSAVTIQRIWLEGKRPENQEKVDSQ